MAAPRPMARKAIMAGMGGWDRSCRHSNADDSIHIRHPDHVRLAEIDAELAEQGRDLAAMVRLMVEHVCEQGAELGRYRLPRHQADVVDTATELPGCQRTDAVQQIGIGFALLRAQMLEIPIKRLIQRVEMAGMPCHAADPQPVDQQDVIVKNRTKTRRMR